MKNWLVSFVLKDDGKEGGYFRKREIQSMVLAVQTVGLSLTQFRLKVRKKRRKVKP